MTESRYAVLLAVGYVNSRLEFGAVSMRWRSLSLYKEARVYQLRPASGVRLSVLAS